MDSRSRLRWTFAITSLALFAFTLDRMVVAVALPAIRADLAADVSGLEWTVNAYTLSFAVLLLTGGALGDRFGRRRMFTIGVTVFTAGRRPPPSRPRSARSWRLAPCRERAAPSPEAPAGAPSSG